MPKISDIKALEVLDSRHYPTIQTTVYLDDNTSGVFTSPSGTSVGAREAVDLKNEVSGKLTVSLAISNLDNIILPALKGMEASKQEEIDSKLIQLDNSKNKKNLGGNTILSVSGAVSVAMANSRRLPLYRYLNQLFQKFIKTPLSIPQPMFLMIEGGAHGLGNIDFQEILLIAPGFARVFEARVAAKQVFYFLEEIVDQKKIERRYGLEGALAPLLKTNQEALSLLTTAISKTAFSNTDNFNIAIDCAGSELKKAGGYEIKDFGGRVSPDQMLNYYQDLAVRFKLSSLEDPFDQEDSENWKKLAGRTGTLLIGDDLTCTNRSLLERAFEAGLVKGVVIKPNQIGTITETFQTVLYAKEKGLKIIASHRSGETMDTFIADFSVAIGADYLKAGGFTQKVREVKYDRLIKIEEELYR